MWKFSFALAIAAIVSIGLKFLVVRADVAIDSMAVAKDLAALSTKRGMKAQLEPIFGGVIMSATGRGCELGVGAITPSGELDQSIALVFARYPRIRYSYEGRLSAERPRLSPLVTFQWSRAANRLGIASRWRPLMIIGDNGLCSSSLTDFSKISAPWHQEVPSNQPR